MKNTLKLMRVRHYIKNVLIFLPLIFGRQFTDMSLLIKTILGALAFCLLTSIVYVINDIKDVEKDRHHPTKCNRPLASGKLSINYAKGLIGVLVVVIVAILILSNNFNIEVGAYLLAYLVLNIAYSFGLKDMPIVDIAILVSGFLIRVLYGSAITGIETSSWLFLTIMSVSLYMSLGKRRNELQKSGESTRKVLKYYNYEFLDKNMVLSLALTDVFYSLWCVSMVDTNQYSSLLLWTIPLAIMLEFKYSLDIEGNSDGDPVEVLFKDKVLLGLGVGFGIIMIILMLV